MKLNSVLHPLTRLHIRDEDAQSLRAAFDGFRDWNGLLEAAEVSGLVPLVNRHLEALDIIVPKATQLSLRALVVRHRSAAQARYELMQELLAVFERESIPVVALKGLALAPMIYQDTAVRPMRDIDLLVPGDLRWRAADLLREIGFDIPYQQPSKFMRDSHQMPNATKKVNGFLISVEIHHDGLSRDVPGHLLYHQIESDLQRVEWNDIAFNALGHETMLHQLCRHLAGLHPGAVLKLINVLDVVLYSETYREQINWANIPAHVMNTLRCLHYIVPLSDELQACIGGISSKPLAGVGGTMPPLTYVASARASTKRKLAMLLSPPDWWQHLYYGVHPDHSLTYTKAVRHPANLVTWVGRRFYSGLLGG